MLSTYTDCISIACDVKLRSFISELSDSHSHFSLNALILSDSPYRYFWEKGLPMGAGESTAVDSPPGTPCFTPVSSSPGTPTRSKVRYFNAYIHSRYNDSNDTFPMLCILSFTICTISLSENCIPKRLAASYRGSRGITDVQQQI